MAKIRTILKSTKDADGRHAVLLMLSDRKQREYFSTGFSADEKEFDASKQGGRFHQGRGVRPFYVKRKEDDGSVKIYSNKDANVVLANMENRASDILKGYNEKHINIAKIRQRFNHSLRQIAQELGFPESQLNITSYTARHSLAMSMLHLDKPVEIISQELGHQSVETTKHYLAKFSSTKMAKETDIDLSY